KAVLICTGDSVRAYDVATGKAVGHPLRKGDGFPLLAFYGRDGRTILTQVRYAAKEGGREELRLWDAGSYQPLGPTTSVAGFVEHIDLHPDSTKVVTTVRRGKEARALLVWEVVDGRIVKPRQLAEASYGDVAFHPNGKAVLACGRDGGYRLWDVATSKPT